MSQSSLSVVKRVHLKMPTNWAKSLLVLKTARHGYLHNNGTDVRSSKRWRSWTWNLITQHWFHMWGTSSYHQPHIRPLSWTLAHEKLHSRKQHFQHWKTKKNIWFWYITETDMTILTYFASPKHKVATGHCLRHCCLWSCASGGARARAPFLVQRLP